MPPLVSCVIPTHNRGHLIRRAINCYEAQTYPNKELVIVDSGNDGTRSLVPLRDDIRYCKVTPPKSTGIMRNICTDLSKGEIICHFDSDDWSAPERVTDQVERLLGGNGILTGYTSMLFYDEVAKQTYRWYWLNGPAFVLGTSLCYTKQYALDYRFIDLRIGEDFRFFQVAFKQFPGRVSQTHAGSLMVALIHGDQTSFKNLSSPNYQKVSNDELPRAFYDLQSD